MRPVVPLALAGALVAGCGSGKAVRSEGHAGRAQANAPRLPRLPPLPGAGFAVQAGPDVVLTSLDGRRAGRVRGASLGYAYPNGAVSVGVGGKRFVLDPAARRVRPRRSGDVPLGTAERPCRSVPGGVALCDGASKPSVRRDGRVLVRYPTPTTVRNGRVPGWWIGAWPSPDGRTLLLQWSGECEIPTAFFASARGGRLRPVTGERDWRKAPESSAWGWAPDGRAIVELPRGGCARGVDRPGWYVIDPPTGKATFLRGEGRVAVWRKR